MPDCHVEQGTPPLRLSLDPKSYPVGPVSLVLGYKRLMLPVLVIKARPNLTLLWRKTSKHLKIREEYQLEFSLTLSPSTVLITSLFPNELVLI